MHWFAEEENQLLLSVFALRHLHLILQNKSPSSRFWPPLLYHELQCQLIVFSLTPVCDLCDSLRSNA